MYNKRLLTILLLVYALIMLYVLLWGLGRIAHANYLYNFTPFSTIKHYVTTDHFGPVQRLLNVVGNILAFVPFGALIPLVFKANFLRTVLIFLAGLLILETAQLVSKRGVFDVDDFILNTLGMALGYLIFKTLSLKTSRESTNPNSREANRKG